MVLPLDEPSLVMLKLQNKDERTALRKNMTKLVVRTEAIIQDMDSDFAIEDFPLLRDIQFVCDGKVGVVSEVRQQGRDFLRQHRSIAGNDYDDFDPGSDSLEDSDHTAYDDPMDVIDDAWIFKFLGPQIHAVRSNCRTLTNTILPFLGMLCPHLQKLTIGEEEERGYVHQQGCDHHNPFLQKRLSTADEVEVLQRGSIALAQFLTGPATPRFLRSLSIHSDESYRLHGPGTKSRTILQHLFARPDLVALKLGFTPHRLGRWVCQWEQDLAPDLETLHVDLPPRALLSQITKLDKLIELRVNTSMGINDFLSTIDGMKNLRRLMLSFADHDTSAIRIEWSALEKVSYLSKLERLVMYAGPSNAMVEQHFTDTRLKEFVSRLPNLRELSIRTPHHQITHESVKALMELDQK